VSTAPARTTAFVDVFPPVPTTSLRRASATTRFLLVAGPAPAFDAEGNGALGAGSVWIQAALLDAAAPTAGYVGLAIEGGSVLGAAPTPGADGSLIVADGAIVVLELVLAPPAPPTGTGPGQDARNADVRLPTTATFSLGSGAGQVTAVGPALLTAYGTTVRLSGPAAAAAVVPELASILVPFEADAADWSAGGAASSLATVAAAARSAAAAGRCR
jgi:hypothetical protein